MLTSLLARVFEEVHIAMGDCPSNADLIRIWMFCQQALTQ